MFQKADLILRSRDSPSSSPEDESSEDLEPSHLQHKNTEQSSTESHSPKLQSPHLGYKRPAGAKFADIVNQFYLPIQRAKIRTPAKPLFSLGRPTIRGWELMDSVDMSPQIRGVGQILSKDTSRWPQMLKNIPTFFCADLEIVTKLQGDNLCDRCKEIPVGHDILAAQVKSLRSLGRRRGMTAGNCPKNIKVAREMWWNPNEKFRKECRVPRSGNPTVSPTVDCWATRQQGLHSRAADRVGQDLDTYDGSLIIFGSALSLLLGPAGSENSEGCALVEPVVPLDPTPSSVLARNLVRRSKTRMLQEGDTKMQLSPMVRETIFPTYP
ncbi:MAG: hypothetical protein MMC33_009398 [Icmadophila ericetorum]|nr:hypothetical protein [Icmadophila ericetorum]